MLFRYDEEWGEKIEDTVEYIFLVDGQCYACGAESGAKEEKRGIEVDKHPIESLMGTTMESIREMVDVNTVVGDPVQTQDGSTIIPISKVSFGFVSGGGEYACGAVHQTDELPFAGGAGAGVSVHPMGFLVCSQSGVRLLSASCASPMERIVEMIPQALEGLRAMGEEEPRTCARVSAAYQE